jgi:hypothetical protein
LLLAAQIAQQRTTPLQSLLAFRVAAVQDIIEGALRFGVVEQIAVGVEDAQRCCIIFGVQKRKDRLPLRRFGPGFAVDAQLRQTDQSLA